MLDHIGIPVSDYRRSLDFYTRSLAPLGIKLIMEVAPELTEDGKPAAGFGRDGKPFFWIGVDARTGPTHVAFVAENREIVRDFHSAALSAGGQDNGGPGLRPHYHPDYYGAFVRDPDGHNIEAVCHTPGNDT